MSQGTQQKALDLPRLEQMTNDELEQYVEHKRAQRDRAVQEFANQEHRAKKRGTASRRIDAQKEIDKAHKAIGTLDRALSKLTNAVNNIKAARALDGDDITKDNENDSGEEQSE